MEAREQRLSTGASLRTTGPDAAAAVVCVNGGGGRDVAGTWSASCEWLVRRVAPRFPQLCFAEVRYRIKCWRRLEMCTEDTLAAVEAVGAERTLLVGFSMGGAVAVRVAAEPSVEAVVGLAPWLPDRLDLSPLDGRRLAVLHGTLDRNVWRVPGVDPRLSRRAFERARARGVDATYTLIPGALHGIAVRAPSGGTVPLPRARRWAELVARELERFQAG